MLEQIIRFISVGAIATMIQYILLIVLVEFLFIDPVIASAIGFALSAIFNYLANYYLTFSSKEPHTTAGLKFSAVATIGLMLNTFCMYLIIDILALPYLYAQVLSTIIVLFWNFFINRYWTYKAA